MRLAANIVLQSSCGLRLKPVELTDASAFYHVIHANQEHFSRFEFAAPHFQSISEVKNVIQQLLQKQADEQGISFGLWKTQELLGLFSVHNIRWTLKEADIGFWLHEKSCGQGLGLKGLSLLKQYCLQTLQLRSLTAHTAISNDRSQNLLEKCGFKPCDRVIGRLTIQGRPIEEIRFRIQA